MRHWEISGLFSFGLTRFFVFDAPKTPKCPGVFPFLWDKTSFLGTAHPDTFPLPGHFSALSFSFLAWFFWRHFPGCGKNNHLWWLWHPEVPGGYVALFLPYPGQGLYFYGQSP
ncbi:hypothetical protein [Maribacter sp. 2307ULW6-5]|uniref:hypothetical protein n=1 Tax=Maribacter sp. 2307ULW6-5 TaxID=3386275 RepID=UPI0039BC62FD